MNLFQAHKPYLFAFLTALVLIWTDAALLDSTLPNFSLFPVMWLILTITIALAMPDSWIRAKPTPDRKVEAAVVFGFGYIMDGEEMLPGSANSFMVDWLIRNRPELKTALAQEGAYREYESRRRENSLPGKLKIISIHRHTPGVYVNSLDAARMAVKIMHSQGIGRVLVVAHHLQLGRAARDMAQVMIKTNLKGEVLIPDLPDVPFPDPSAQWHTRRKWRYKLVELLLSRPRDYWRC